MEWVTTGVRGRIVMVLALLLAANLAVWLWALAAFHGWPVLMGTALLAYGLGLRHAVDADHIAAIDNVTRKLMQQGQQPVTVGLFFALGHSTIVVLASLIVAFATSAFKSRMDVFHTWGGTIGTLVSASFLLLIAGLNLIVLHGIWRSLRHVRAGGSYAEEDADRLMAGTGLLARFFRPAFRLIRAPWQMYPLGVLFGLGFDTAGEVALLGVSAAEAARTLPVWSIMVFPALFTAGMTLADTADSMVMLGAYRWAFMQPMRKLFYNLTITAVSALVALLVGGIEVLGLIGPKLGLHGRLGDGIGVLNDHLGAMGLVILGIFVATWGIAVLLYRLGGYDRVEVRLAEAG